MNNDLKNIYIYFFHQSEWTKNPNKEKRRTVTAFLSFFQSSVYATCFLFFSFLSILGDECLSVFFCFFVFFGGEGLGYHPNLLSGACRYAMT